GNVLFGQSDVCGLPMWSDEWVRFVRARQLVPLQAGGQNSKAAFNTLRADAALFGGHRKVSHTGTTGRRADELATFISRQARDDVTLSVPNVFIFNGHSS